MFGTEYTGNKSRLLAVERTRELEFKGDLGVSFATAAAREAFIRTLAPVHHIHEKQKRRLIVDTPGLDIYGRGFDCVVGFSGSGRIRQRFKSHHLDRRRIMERTEDVAVIGHKKDRIIVAPSALATKKDRDKLRDIRPRDLRAIGIMDYASSRLRLCIDGKDSGVIEIKVDHVRITPLFKGASQVILNEVEVDSELDNREILNHVVQALQRLHPDLVPVRFSKVQQALKTWKTQIARAAGDLPKPALSLFD